MEEKNGVLLYTFTLTWLAFTFISFISYGWKPKKKRERFLFGFFFIKQTDLLLTILSELVSRCLFACMEWNNIIMFSLTTIIIDFSPVLRYSLVSATTLIRLLIREISSSFKDMYVCWMNKHFHIFPYFGESEWRSVKTSPENQDRKKLG